MALIIPSLLVLQTILGILFGIVTSLIQLSIQLFSWLPTEIYTVWSLVRNLANMGFILALIVMAFGTIFNIHKYTFRDMFVWFLVAALLINFSYPIGTYILDLGNGLTNVIITTTRDNIGGGGGGLWHAIAGRGLKVQALTDSFGKGVACSIPGASTASALFGWITGRDFLECNKIMVNLLLSNVLLLVGLIAYSVVEVMLLIRIPFIWILLIISPIAWLGLALPNLNKAWKWWWEHFISWVFWFPVYLFILMILMILLNARGQATFDYSGAPLAQQVFQFVGGNDIVFYFITIIFLYGGIWASFKVSKIVGGSAGAIGDWINHKVYEGAKWGALHAPIPVGGGKTTNLAAGIDATKDSWKRFTKKLASDQDMRKAGVAQRYEPFLGKFGVTPEKPEETALLKKIKEKAEALEKVEHVDYEELRRRLPSASGEKLLALQYLQSKNAWFKTEREFSDTLDHAGGSGTELGRSILKNVADTKFKGIFGTPQDIANFGDRSSDPAVKRTAYDSIRKALPNDDAIRKYLKMTENESYEEKKKIEEDIKESIKKTAKNEKERKAILAIPYASNEDKEYKRLLGSVMLENEEINDNKSWNEYVALYPPGHAKIAEGKEKIDKYSPVLGAEINLRENYSIANPTLPPYDLKAVGSRTGTEYGTIKNAFRTKLDDIGKKYDKVADASVEEWETHAFEDALRERIEYLEENIRRTKPAHWELNPDIPVTPGTPNAASLIQKDGAGREYLRSIQKETNSTEKLKIIRKIIDHYKGIDAATIPELGSAWAGFKAWSD